MSNEWIKKIFLDLGINPVYAVTFLMLLFSLSETKKIKIWKTLTFVQRQFAILTWVATLFCIIGSIVVLFDIHH